MFVPVILLIIDLLPVPNQVLHSSSTCMGIQGDGIHQGSQVDHGSSSCPAGPPSTP
jgi:hypothetical protein